MRFLRLSIGVAVTLCLLSSAYAHSGRTDAQGGHHDRKNGGYHYHNSGTAPAPRYTPPPAPKRIVPPPRPTTPNVPPPSAEDVSQPDPKPIKPPPPARPKLTPRYTAHFASGRSMPVVEYREEKGVYWVKGVTGSESRYPKKLLKRFEPIAQAAKPKAKLVTGKVVGVSDGDSLTLLVAKKQYKIRLAGIDCPESSQAFGTKAKQALSAKVFGKTVKVLKTDTDRYGRIVAVVFADGCVNTQLVREGLAWHYKQYSDSKTLADAEAQARKDKVGLWADANPQPPWEFRKAPAPSAGLPEDPPPKATASKTNSTTVYVTRTGTKYHRASCRHLAKSKYAMSLADAEKLYGPCGTCKPSAPRTSPVASPRPTVAPTAKPATAANTHWVTSSSGIRHNSSCRYYQNSKGRACDSSTGRACKICGG